MLIGSGHPVFPGHHGKLNRLMEICSSRRTHVESHDISPLPSCIISPCPPLLESPESAHCSFSSFWTSTRLFRHLSLLCESLAPNIYVCVRFISSKSAVYLLKIDQRESNERRKERLKEFTKRLNEKIKNKLSFNVK